MRSEVGEDRQFEGGIPSSQEPSPELSVVRSADALSFETFLIRMLPGPLQDQVQQGNRDRYTTGRGSASDMGSARQQGAQITVEQGSHCGELGMLFGDASIHVQIQVSYVSKEYSVNTMLW